MSEMIARLQGLLDSGQDSAMLRLSLASALIAADRAAEAVAHLERSLELDAGYSAAYRLLGKSLLAMEEHRRALEVCERGIAVARSKGDLQAAKEMEVFARRARKRLESPTGEQ